MICVEIGHWGVNRRRKKEASLLQIDGCCASVFCTPLYQKNTAPFIAIALCPAS